MIGCNKLELCAAELLVAIQEYLDKRMGDYAPKASDVKQERVGGVFVITLKQKDAE